MDTKEHDIPVPPPEVMCPICGYKGEFHLGWSDTGICAGCQDGASEESERLYVNSARAEVFTLTQLLDADRDTWPSERVLRILRSLNVGDSATLLDEEPQAWKRGATQTWKRVK